MYFIINVRIYDARALTKNATRKMYRRKKDGSM